MECIKRMAVVAAVVGCFSYEGFLNRSLRLRRVGRSNNYAVDRVHDLLKLVNKFL